MLTGRQWKRLGSVLVLVIAIVAALAAVISWKMSEDIRIYHAQARVFWGDLYNPAQRGLPWDTETLDGQMLDRLIPKGGPVIAREYVDNCDALQVPFVPMRMTEDGRFEALCGIGDSSTVQELTLEDWLAEGAREAVIKIRAGNDARIQKRQEMDVKRDRPAR